MKNLILIIMSLTLIGCAVISKEKTVGPKTFDRKAAVTLAVKQLSGSEYQKDYSVYSPRVIEDIFTQDHPDYWFISFAARDYDRSFWHYLVVIHKETKEVTFAGPFVGERTGDYDWVFDKK